MSVYYFRDLAAKIFTRKALIVLGIGAGLLLILNAAVLLLYLNKSYPRTSLLGEPVGNKNFSEITSGLGSFPGQQSITIIAGGKTERVEVPTLVDGIDNDGTVAATRNERSVLPLFDLFRSHRITPAVRFNEQVLKTEVDRLYKSFDEPAADAKIVIKSGLFTLSASSEGRRLPTATLESSIRQAVTDDKAEILLSSQAVEPKIKTEDLQGDFLSLKRQQNASITYTNAGRSHKLQPTNIAAFFEPKRNSFELSQERIRLYVINQGAQWGIKVNNAEAVAAETKKALASGRADKFTYGLSGPRLARSFSYCIALKEVNGSHLNVFSSKVAGVLGSSRGWSLEGDVVFRQVSSGCQFTMWLAAAKTLPSFGAICEPAWSCRVGRNVVINFDRWRFATDAWNNAGGSLDDYRSMVINHETGHWLGFGHSSCSGAGRLAPVMQQQSINLQGCKFNPWPTSSELSSLRSRLSLR